MYRARYCRAWVESMLKVAICVGTEVERLAHDEEECRHLIYLQGSLEGTMHKVWTFRKRHFRMVLSRVEVGLRYWRRSDCDRGRLTPQLVKQGDGRSTWCKAV